MSHIENNRPYPVTAGYQKSVTADRPGPGLCGAWILLFCGRMFELSLVRCSGSAMVPRKVIEDLEGAGVWGGLAPIKKKMVSSRKALNHPHSHIY